MGASPLRLNLNGVDYSLDRLPDDAVNLNSFERSIMHFCQDWLAGKEKFELSTSGSTGLPKLITITRKQMCTSAQHTAHALKLERNMNALVCLDTRYIAGIMMLVRCLEVEMNIIARNPCANPFEFISDSDQIDFAALVPYQVSSILDSPFEKRFHQIHSIIVGGAPLNKKYHDLLQQYRCRFYATYGMTETVSHVALQPLNGEEATEVFQALPGVTLSQDERGCLVIDADYILNNHVVTNDMVELLDDHSFRWLGRWDNVINSGGLKIIPEELEKTILSIFTQNKINNRFFLAGQADEKLGQRVILVMEGAPNSEIEIQRALQEISEPFKRPREVLWVEKFTDTETGKVNRSQTLSKIPSRAPHK